MAFNETSFIQTEQSKPMIFIGFVSASLSEVSILSGKRDSNSPPTAWKAVALPDELLPLIFSVQIYEKVIN